MGNLQTVQKIYGAFGRGDVPAILEKLADNVEWECGSNSTSVPYLQPRRGRNAVGGFFESLGALEFQKFEPKTFLETGNTVVALIDVDLSVKSSGTQISEQDEAHIWHFDSEGRVARFKHFVDSHAHQVANG